MRSTWFSQNFSEGYFTDQVRSGEVASRRRVREPFVDVDHIADVAVAALTEHGHVGRLYELTGPRLLTFADAVAEIASATGRDAPLRADLASRRTRACCANGACRRTTSR